MKAVIFASILLITIAIAYAQSLWKISSAESRPTFFHQFIDLRFLIGGCIYAISTIAWIGLLSFADLSYMHPLFSLRFVFALLFARFLLGEQISRQRAVAVGFILIGVAIVGV